MTRKEKLANLLLYGIDKRRRVDVVRHANETMRATDHEVTFDCSEKCSIGVAIYLSSAAVVGIGVTLGCARGRDALCTSPE